MSTIIRWRITLLISLMLFIGGFTLSILLALGLADPPRAGTLQWRVESPVDWTETQTQSEDWTFSPAPVQLPTAFTLELTATNHGASNSAWGIQVFDAKATQTILIDNQGYFSVSSNAEQPYWRAFIHIRPAAANKLYLHVEPDQQATLRINDEVAWEGRIKASTWQLVSYQQPQLNWEQIALYYEE